MHAVAIGLHVARGAGVAPSVLAEQLRLRHPRETLRLALPGCSPELYRVLGRATSPVWELDTYRTLDLVLQSTVAEVITEATQITPSRVQDARALLDADPILRRARRAYATRHQQEHLSTVVGLIRHLGLAQDLAELPDGAGRQSVARRVQSDLGRARCAKDGFPVPAGWDRIETVGALWGHGRRLKICLAPGTWQSGGYVLEMLRGQSVFLLHSSNVVAQLGQITHGLWRLVQVSGAENDDVPEELVEALQAELAVSGMRLLPCDPAEALHHVLRPTDPSGAPDPADEDEQFQEIMEAALQG
ncbi:hypothetical protein [Roseomonas chloroacetimidivorans]|uniref:hypothetical protein n=1 Tax=Roseomonas chloroacetimidivorans TaxID=1766656 RepID=UPI003C7642E8